MTDELASRRRKDGRRKPRILCQGTSKQTGKPCTQPPAPGSKFCRFHTGHTRPAHAARVIAEAKLRRAIPPPERWRHLDPLEAADMYRAEADAWLAVLREEVTKLESFEVTAVLTFGDGGKIEKVGAEIRALVALYTQALSKCFDMATTAVKLGIHQRAVEQLEQQSELFARVLGETMRMLALDVPVETYAAVLPRAIEAVRAEVAG
jgi:hypothetical protein